MILLKTNKLKNPKAIKYGVRVESYDFKKRRIQIVHLDPEIVNQKKVKKLFNIKY